MNDVSVNRRRFLGLAGSAIAVGALAPAKIGSVLGTPAASGAVRRAFIGAYTVAADTLTGVAAPGIGLAAVDPVTGRVTVDGYYTGVANSFSITLSPQRDVLYAASDVPDARVYALRVGPGGGLQPLNDQSTEGAGGIYVSVHPSGRYLLTANYDSGSVVVNPILPGGSLGPVTCFVQQTGSGPVGGQQDGPHAHQTVTDPTGRRVLVPDKGNDYVYVYGFDVGTGQLLEQSQVYIAPGAGPRHLVFHPSGQHVYLVDELSSSVTILRYLPGTGELWPVRTVSTVPPGTNPLNAPSGIQLSRDARFAYVANRGLDSIAIFAVRDGGGTLQPIAQQAIGSQPFGYIQPYDLTLDRTGQFLYTADMVGQAIAVFRVDRATGLLAQADPPAVTASPLCIEFR
jgi:6-phosphogluconolactonase